MHSANGLAWSVCVCVCMCVSDSTAYPAVADKQIELPLRMCNCRGQKLKKHELHRVYPNTDDFSKPGFRVRFGFCSFERRRQAYNAYGVYNSTRDLRSFEIRFEFESAVPIRFDSTVMGRFENFRIGRVCPLLAVVRRLKPLTALSGTVCRLASSMSDHTPVLFNVLEPLRIGMRNL